MNIDISIPYPYNLISSLKSHHSLYLLCLLIAQIKLHQACFFHKIADSFIQKKTF